jgi:hypothetical protein
MRATRIAIGCIADQDQNRRAISPLNNLIERAVTAGYKRNIAVGKTVERNIIVAHSVFIIPIGADPELGQQ